MKQTRLIIITITAITLFLGGIILLISRVTFWSYYFGIPATQIGIILLILVFEKASHKTLDDKIEEDMLTSQSKQFSSPTQKNTQIIK